ncbi:MAG: hypothetical protein Q6373_006435 [Candidatus Sigynarchaeota archaeon]
MDGDTLVYTRYDRDLLVVIMKHPEISSLPRAGSRCFMDCAGKRMNPGRQQSACKKKRSIAGRFEHDLLT